MNRVREFSKRCDEMDKKRMTAKKLRISDLINGKYFAGSKEEMKPSYVITSFGEKISRVNLIGTVTDKFVNEDETYSSATLDDGTETIRLKAFREDVRILKDLELGDLILAIGKVKEYNGEIYVNAEVAKRLKDANFENLRKLEILKELVEQKKVIDDIRNVVDQLSEEELKEYVKNKFGLDEESLQVIIENLRIKKEIDYKPKILEVIKILDEGKGVEIGKIFQLSNLPENVIESAIDELMADGTLFEPTAGVLKIV